jgi:hypothetical protein
MHSEAQCELLQAELAIARLRGDQGRKEHRGGMSEGAWREKGAAAAIENGSENFRDFFPHRKTIHEFSVLWLFFSSPTSSVGGFFLRVVWQEGRGTPAP